MKKNRTVSSEPIYRKLVHRYVEGILGHTLSPGSRIDSINEIQKKHAVSRETAKLVLKKLAEEGYILQRPGKGSFVRTAKRKQKVWVVILPFYSAQYEDLLGHFTECAARQDRKVEHLLDYNNSENETRLVGAAIARGVEAVIVIPNTEEKKTARFYARLSSQDSFLALADHTMTGSYFPYAIQTYDLGVRRAVRYLLEKKKGRAAFVKNDLWAGQNPVQTMMEETFREVMTEAFPKFEPVVLEGYREMDAGLFYNEGVKGVFCCDDADAIRVIGLLKEQGVRIPEDIALVSYGNTALARYFTPAITSVDPHNREMAEKITSILQLHLDGGNTDLCQYVIQPDLIVRAT